MQTVDFHTWPRLPIVWENLFPVQLSEPHMKFSGCAFSECEYRNCLSGQQFSSQPFWLKRHKACLRLPKNIDIYIVIHNSSKFTIMK